MKRLTGHCGLFQLAQLSKEVTRRASALAASPKLHVALVLSCLLTPVSLGQGGGLPGGFSGSASGFPGSFSEGAIADTVNSAAFRERCLLLSTRFKHQGIDFQSHSGIGCIISTPQGQRILAMPLSMTMPVKVVQGNEKLSVECSMLLAAKVGDSNKFQESLASFTQRVDEIPIESSPTQARKEPLRESERRIYRALDERGEVSFNAQPLSGVMKFFETTFDVPIVIDNKQLEIANLTPDEPVNLNLPPVSFRSALNLILKPLNLTFVVRNEVLLITSNEEAAKADDLVSHWNPVGPELDAERKIFRALSERGDVNFNAQPLSGVMKYFTNTFEIPIVLDVKAMDTLNITQDEPTTLNLPPVSFRSALNLILDPLGLTYVIENEILLITSKASALAEHPAPFISANSKGVIAVGLKVIGMGGMGGGMGISGTQDLPFKFTPTQRYSSLPEAQKADVDLRFSTAGGMMTANGSQQRREFAAIHGPLASVVDKTLGVAFVSLPGDFQAVPIPARVKAAGKRFVMLGQSWIEITPDRDNLAAVINGSPVIDEQGESIGMLIDQKVVSLAELVQSLLSIDSKRLGYWGAETKAEVTVQEKEPPLEPVPANSNDELPELVTPELKKQLERAASLKGKEKKVGLEEIEQQLYKRIQQRNAYAEEKLKSIQSKLERLTQLSDRMTNQDRDKVAKLMQGTPPPIQGKPEEDSFK